MQNLMFHLDLLYQYLFLQNPKILSNMNIYVEEALA